jgi:hypothetical protein
MKNRPTVKNKAGLLLALSAVLALGANAAVAGEVNGKGKPVPGGSKGKSECSYSGLQDDAAADEGVFRGDRVQSWGQMPLMLREFLTAIGFHPGDACNPRKSDG